MARTILEWLLLFFAGLLGVVIGLQFIQPGLDPRKLLPEPILIEANCPTPSTREPTAKSKPSPCDNDRTSFRCVNYVNNTDGRTFLFNLKGVPFGLGERVQVLEKDIRVPRMQSKRHCERLRAVFARKIAKEIIASGKQIDLENVRRDSRRRLLAEIKIDGKSLGKTLVEKGLAHFHTDRKPNWCQ